RTNSFALAGTTEEDKRFEDERLEVAPMAMPAMARAPESDRPEPQSERMRKSRAC
ncbi:MAG: hypothetical protein JO041_03800, partial [Acidobacteria bacterium]|nr:hypothetical protein [Acidobacteriota bacterium]